MTSAVIPRRHKSGGLGASARCKPGRTSPGVSEQQLQTQSTQRNSWFFLSCSLQPPGSSHSAPWEPSLWNPSSPTKPNQENPSWGSSLWHMDRPRCSLLFPCRFVFLSFDFSTGKLLGSSRREEQQICLKQEQSSPVNNPISLT